LARLMPNSQATKIDETAGNLVLPDGRRIHARIGFYKVNVPMNIGGVQREVTDYAPSASRRKTRVMMASRPGMSTTTALLRVQASRYSGISSSLRLAQPSA